MLNERCLKLSLVILTVLFLSTPLAFVRAASASVLATGQESGRQAEAGVCTAKDMRSLTETLQHALREAKNPAQPRQAEHHLRVARHEYELLQTCLYGKHGRPHPHGISGEQVATWGLTLAALENEHKQAVLSAMAAEEVSAVAPSAAEVELPPYQAVAVDGVMQPVLALAAGMVLALFSGGATMFLRKKDRLPPAI